MTVIELYQDKGGSWRWRCMARNGQVVACSGEAFSNFYNCKRSAERAKVTMQKSEIKKK